MVPGGAMLFKQNAFPVLPSLSALPERLTRRHGMTMAARACPFGGLAQGQPLSSEDHPANKVLASPFA